MERWKLSRYTKVIESDSKDVLLHNSFMGAIAQIPPQKSRKLKKYLKNGFKKNTT
nr:hypothetical protein [Methanobacterium formicicum]